MIHLPSLSISATLSLEKTGFFPIISFIEMNLSQGDNILYLGELGPLPRKTGITGGTCSSSAFSLEEVKLSSIFSLGKNLPFGGGILTSIGNLFLLRGTTLSLDQHLGNLPSTLSLGKTGLFSFFLGTVTSLTTLSFGGVNLPLGKNNMFLKEHSLNLLASFSLGVVTPNRGGPFYNLFSKRNEPIS